MPFITIIHKDICSKCPHKGGLGCILETFAVKSVPQTLWEHSNSLTESVPAGLVETTFQQDWLLEVSHKSGRTGLQ